MNDYKEMQRLYEGFLGQSAEVVNYGPNIKYTPHNPHKNTLAREPGGLPFQAAGSRGTRRYDAGLGGQNITRVVGDEEVKEKKISNTAVINKIEELITKAEEEDNPTCTYALAQLMKHVKELPEAK